MIFFLFLLCVCSSFILLSWGLSNNFFFLIQMSNISRVSDQNGVSLLYIKLEIHHSGREPSIWIYVISLAHPATLHGTSSNVKHYIQTLLLNLFILAMLISTIDFYHFIPLSVTLSLAGGSEG